MWAFCWGTHFFFDYCQDVFTNLLANACGSNLLGGGMEYLSFTNYFQATGIMGRCDLSII